MHGKGDYISGASVLARIPRLTLSGREGVLKTPLFSQGRKEPSPGRDKEINFHGIKCSRN